MRNAVTRFILLAIALALTTPEADAQWGVGDYPNPDGSPLCSDYVPVWLELAKTAQAKGCSPGGPEWSTDVKVLGAYCLSAGSDAMSARTNEMLRTMNNCDYCVPFVDQWISYTVDNILYNCGFSNKDGRWTPDRQYQMNKWMKTYVYYSNVITSFYGVEGRMGEQIAACKLTHQRRDCVSCHNSQSSAAVQAVPKSGSLRNSLQQLPSRPKLNATDTVVDPCKPGVRGATFPCKQPTSKVIDPGMLEGGNDLSRQGPGATGNPGGGAGSPATSPLYNRVR